MTASHVTTPSTTERIRPWVVLIALPVTLAAAATSLATRLLGAPEIVVVVVGILGVVAVSVPCGRRVLRLRPGRAR